MARKKGNIEFASNFEVNSQAPLDARLVVNTKSELTDINTWSNSGKDYYIYKGMQVSVISEKKVYMYVADTVSAENIKLNSSWKEIGSDDYNGLQNKPAINNVQLDSNFKIKTINNQSLIGESNINIDIIDDYNKLHNRPAINGQILDTTSKMKTINGLSLLGSGNIEISGGGGTGTIINLGEIIEGTGKIDSLNVGTYYGHVPNGNTFDFGYTRATNAKCDIKGELNSGYIYIEVFSPNGSKNSEDGDNPIIIQKIHVDSGTTITRIFRTKPQIEFITASDILADFKKVLEGGGGETTEDVILFEDGTTAILLENSASFEPWSTDTPVVADYKYMLLENSKIN